MSLRRDISTPDGKRRYVKRLFHTIADRYDFITGFLSYGQDRRWKRRLVALAELRSDDRLLDLACGTGDIVGEAAPQVEQAVGLDLTHRMLQLAARRAHPLRAASRGASGRAGVRWVTGDMLALPFPDGYFTVVTVGYGLRNVPDLNQAIREIRRVLAPGGRFLSLDFNRPDNAVVRGVYLTYLTIVGSVLGLMLHRDPDTYRYIPESIRRYPGAQDVARRIHTHGFGQLRVKPLLGGLMTIHTARASGQAQSPRPMA